MPSPVKVMHTGEASSEEEEDDDAGACMSAVSQPLLVHGAGAGKGRGDGDDGGAGDARAGSWIVERFSLRRNQAQSSNLVCHFCEPFRDRGTSR